MSYARKLRRFIAARKADGEFKRDQLNHVTVAHDNWCDFLNGKGGCNCDAVVSLGAPKNPASVLEIIVDPEP